MCVRSEKHSETSNPIDEALSWHDGDARAAIATLLADCAHLRWQLELAGRAMSMDFLVVGVPSPIETNSLQRCAIVAA